MMKKLSLLVLAFFALTFIVSAETINEKYSYKDFMHKSFRDVSAQEFNGTVIVGSCFYQEGKPNTAIFPNGMVGVTFRNCNLDNVYIPAGNTVEGGTHKKIRVMNDLDDWILDKDLKPVEPINKEQRLEAGISIDPKDIPMEKIDAKDYISIFN